MNNVTAKFKIKDGRLNVAPFDIKKDGIVMNVQGTNGLDQTMAYNLALNLPRVMLGAKANETANAMIAKLNSKAGTNVSISETIKVNAVLGGTILRPTIGLKYGAGNAKSTAKDTVKAKATEKVKDAIAEKLNCLFKRKN